MTVTLAYLLVVLPLVALAVAAVWVPRPWQLVLLLSGPALSLLAVADVANLDRLGWPATIGVAYAYLLVLPVLPWRRRWGRVAIPATVVVVSVLLVGFAEGSPAMAVVLAPPVLLALGALAVVAVSWTADRRAGTAIS